MIIRSQLPFPLPFPSLSFPKKNKILIGIRHKYFRGAERKRASVCVHFEFILCKGIIVLVLHLVKFGNVEVCDFQNRRIWFLREIKNLPWLSRILLGLMSLCMQPFSCRCFMPWISILKIFLAIDSGV